MDVGLQEMSDWRDGGGGWAAKEVWKEGKQIRIERRQDERERMIYGGTEPKVERGGLQRG